MAWEKAKALVGDDTPDCQIGRCLAWVSAGELDKAVAVASELMNAVDRPAEEHYNLARVWARCCNHPTVGDRRPVWVRHLLECLVRAEKGDYFRHAAQVNSRLDEQVDFGTIRNEDQYKQFRAALDQSAKP